MYRPPSLALHYQMIRLELSPGTVHNYPKSIVSRHPIQVGEACNQSRRIETNDVTPSCLLQSACIRCAAAVPRQRALCPVRGIIQSHSLAFHVYN